MESAGGVDVDTAGLHICTLHVRRTVQYSLFTVSVESIVVWTDIGHWTTRRKP